MVTETIIVNVMSYTLRDKRVVWVALLCSYGYVIVDSFSGIGLNNVLC